MNPEILQWSERIGWMLIHSLWQGTLIAAAVALLLPYFNSAGRHALLIFGMLMTGCAAVFTAATVEVTPKTVLIADLAETAVDLRWASIDGSNSPGTSRSFSKEVESSRVPNPELILSRKPATGHRWESRNLLYILTITWLISIAWLGLQKLYQTRVLKNWKTSSSPTLPPPPGRSPQTGSNKNFRSSKDTGHDFRAGSGTGDFRCV